jgi:hypothetical protein
MSDPVLFLNSTMTYATSVSTDEEVLVDHKGSLLSQFVLILHDKKTLKKYHC